MALGITALDRLKWLGLARAPAVWGDAALYTVGDAPRGVETYGVRIFVCALSVHINEVNMVRIYACMCACDVQTCEQKEEKLVFTIWARHTHSK